MPAVITSRSEALERLSRELPCVSATHLVAGMPRVTSTVLAEGAVLITRHDQPTMVLLSVDRYLKLEKAAEPNLDALTSRFEDMYARMQGQAQAKAMADAFAMGPEALGDAALRVAVREASRG